MKLPIFSKIILTLFLGIFAFSLFSTSISAQDCSAENPELCAVEASKQWASTPETLKNTLDTTNTESFETFNARTILETMQLLDLGFGGAHSPGQVADSGGAIQIAGGFITQMVTRPPTSSVEYLADLGSKAGLVKPAYAQDSTGYRGLSGVLQIWKAFRNIAYAFFVIIFVVVGFMIMFRTKLNPQTAVNLQLALPKLIITLILITFSYAIAGFILDLIYFIIYLTANVFTAFNLPTNITIDDIFSKNIIEIFSIFNPWETAKNFGNSLQILFEGAGAKSIEITGKLLTEGIFGLSIVRLIVSGGILFSIFKLLFQLIIAYVNIIIQVIFAPIMLLFNALPQSNAFSSWIKNLIANAAAFPATAIMIMVGSALISSSSDNISQTFAPPFINFGIDDQSLLSSIIGLGIIFLLPKIVTMIQEALKVKPALPIGPAIGSVIGAPVRIATQATQYGYQEVKSRQAIRAQTSAIASAIRGEKSKEKGKA